jgi:hypothetical protein
MSPFKHQAILDAHIDFINTTVPKSYSLVEALHVRKAAWQKLLSSIGGKQNLNSDDWDCALFINTLPAPYQPYIPIVTLGYERQEGENAERFTLYRLIDLIGEHVPKHILEPPQVDLQYETRPLKAASPRNNKKRKSPGARPAQPSPKRLAPSCNHCNKRGHSQDRCWFLHPELRTPNLKK